MRVDISLLARGRLGMFCLSFFPIERGLLFRIYMGRLLKNNLCGRFLLGCRHVVAVLGLIIAAGYALPASAQTTTVTVTFDEHQGSLGSFATAIPILTVAGEGGFLQLGRQPDRIFFRANQGLREGEIRSLEIRANTGLNYESKNLYTVGVQYLGGDTDASYVVIVTVNNIVEHPSGNYASNFRATASDTEITLNWSIDDYLIEFAEPSDQGSIVISYGTGSTFSTMTVATDAVDLTLSSLTASTPYTITLRYFSADRSYGGSTRTLVQSTAGAAGAPVFEPVPDLLVFSGQAYSHSLPVDFTSSRLVSDSSGDITVSIPSPPAWFTTTPSLPATLSDSEKLGFAIATSAAKGTHPITLQAQDPDGNQAADRVFSVFVVDPPDLTGWTVADGKISFAFNSGICAGKNIVDAQLHIQFAENSNKSNTFTMQQGLNNCRTSYQDPSLWGGFYYDSTSFFPNYDLADSDTSKLQVIFPTPSDSFHFWIASSFFQDAETNQFENDLSIDIDYKVRNVNVTVAEGMRTAGSKLLTLTLASADAVTSPGWFVAGGAEKNVEVAAVSGSQTRQGVLSLVGTENIDYDANSDNVFARLTLVTHTSDQTASSQVAVETRLVVEISEQTDGIEVGALSPATALTGSSKEAVANVQLASLPLNQNVTVTIVSSVPADLKVFPDKMVFTPSDGSTAQPLTVSLTDTAIRRDGNIDVNLMVHDASNSASNYRSVAPVVLAVPVNKPNMAPTFASDRRSRSINENLGTISYTGAVNVGAPVTAADGDNPTGLVYSIDPVNAIFGIDATSGQLTLKTPVNLNHERRAAHTVTVKVHDGEHASVRGTGTVTVAIAVNNQVENPSNYSSVDFRQLGRTRTAVTLAWDNAEYLAEYAAEDRGSVVIVMHADLLDGSLNVPSTMTAAITQTVLAIAVRGTQTGNNITTTLRFYSKDGSSGTANYTLQPTLDPNATPTFTANSLLATISENFGSAQMLAVGVAVATIVATDSDSDPLTFSLRSGLDEATFGVKANGEVTVKVATNFNNEVKDKYTLNVRVADGIYGASQTRQWVLSIADIDEDPVFANDNFPNQSITGVQGGDFTFHAAANPDDPDNANAITYAAGLINPVQTLPHAGLSFDPVTRVFTVAANSAGVTLTVRVTASDQDTPPEDSVQGFEVVIVDNGIDAPSSASMSKSTRSAVLPVKLLREPVGGGGVTLALSSANAAHVTFTPAQLVFNASNWSTAQNATVSLLQAGVAVKGDRSVQLQVAVSDISDVTNYGGVTPVAVAVAVSVPNEEPVFDPDTQRSRSIDEGSYDAGDPVGAPVVASDEDNDPGELSYTLVGSSEEFEVNASSGQISFKAATDLDHEFIASYQLTIKAADGETAAAGIVPGAATVTVSIMVADVNEPPVLVLPEAYGVIEGFETSYQVIAGDPEDEDLTYTAVLLADDGSQTSLPAGVSFDGDTGTFTFADTLPVDSVFVIRVVASDGSQSAQGDFVVVVYPESIIVGPQSVPLSRTNSEAVFEVQLGVEPSSDEVTLTLASQAPREVSVRPVTLVFDGSDWDDPQPVTMRLLDAGLAIKGERQVQLSLGVFDRANSDVVYNFVPARLQAVQIANVNVPPVFAFAGDPVATEALGLAIDETVGRAQLAADTDVGSPIVAVDVDNAAGLTYSLVGGDGSFSIGADDAQLVAVAGMSFNYERQSSREVVVQVSDGQRAAPGVELGLATVTVLVQINDVDEKPDDYVSSDFRVIARTRTDITLNWNNVEYERQFEELDRGRIEVSYGLSAGGFAHTLTVGADATSARIVDLVPGVGHDVSLQWFSADGVSQDTPVVLSSVSAGSNDAPTFAGALMYSRPENIGLAESVPSGTALATVQATDAQNDEITYSIPGGELSRLFAIDPQSGVIILLRRWVFNHESRDSYRFMVRASDEYGASTVAQVVLSIADVEEAPMLPGQFDQTAIVGTQKTIELRVATSEDTGKAVQYTIEQSNGAAVPGWLTINPANGELTVGTTATAGTITLRLRAVAVASSSILAAAAAGSGAVALNESEVMNEQVFRLVVAASGSTNSAPVFASEQVSFSLTERVEFASGHVLGTLVATDSNSGDTPSYSLRGLDAGVFQIDPASGVLSLREAQTFDPEQKFRYRFLVDADDGNGGLASAEVFVSVTQRGNTSPVFTMSQQSYQVPARRRVSLFVTPAVDREDGLAATTYTARLPGAWITFDADTLGFTVLPNAPLGSHRVTLVATDTDSASANHVFMVNIRAVGNVAPVFADAAVQFEVVFERRQAPLASGTIIGSVVATDANDDMLAYRLFRDDSNLFSVDQSGRIRIAAGEQLPVEGTRYKLVVEVSDGRGGVATVSVDIIVRLPVQEASDVNQDKVVLLAIDRLVAAAATDLVQARLNAPTAPSGGSGLTGLAEQEPPYLQMSSAQQQWEDWRYESDHDTDAGERMGWEDFLVGGGFDFALDGSQGSGAQRRVWGAASRASMDGVPLEDGSLVFYDGKTNMVMMGADYGRSDKRFGIAVGNSKSEVLVGENKGDKVEYDLNVIQPYVSMMMFDSSRVWLSGAVGSGEYVRGANTENATRTSRDTGYLSLAAGVEGSWSHELVEISSGFKALVVNSKLYAQGRSPSATGKALRMQADFKASSSFTPVPEVALRPFIGAHLYHDGGDEWQGASAVDTSAGLNLKWDRGLQLDFSSRWNDNEDGEVSEKRFDASISYDFGSDGRGLQFEVSPRMSNSSASENDRSLSGSASYGLPVRLFSDSALGVFKADFASSAKGIVVDRYGFRFAGRRLDVDLAADGEGGSWRIDLKLR